MGVKGSWIVFGKKMNGDANLNRSALGRFESTDLRQEVCATTGGMTSKAAGER